MNLRDILAPARINKAVSLYLEHAYDNDAQRCGHELVFPANAENGEILARFEDETEKRPGAHHSYSVRMGSAEYPHMKLAIHEAFFRAEYILVVDRHDAFRFAAGTPGYDDWMRVRSRNRQRKIDIERAWHEAGLPTMRMIKELALSRTDMMLMAKEKEILLVDDDADAATIVRLLLRSDGYKVRYAKSVAEALAVVADPQAKIGVALIDVLMGDDSGLDVLRAIRQEPRLQDIPVMLMTGVLEADIESVADEVIYLRKPYNSGELLAAVREALCEQCDGSGELADL